MQKQFLAGALILIALMLSCAPKKSQPENPSSAGPDAWPEMESFHMVMADAYHPYQEDKNLEPVKSLAENLAREAEKWATAPLPPKVNNAEVRAKLQKLKNDSRKLADLVKSGATDQEVGESLSALHEHFHGIMEAWRGDHPEEKAEH